jgi:hypothetical protein
MTDEPSGVSVWSPKITNESLVRKFISLNGNGYIAIAIQDNTTGSQALAVDPDPESLALAIWFNDVVSAPSTTNPYGTQVLTVTADSITRADVGAYYYDLGPALTGNRGLITAVWTYTVNSVQFQFTDHLQVLDPMPLYDSLTDGEKSTVEQVSWMFGDLYDSTEGGPHIIEEFQTKWNYERIAQMMGIAVTRMNMLGNYGNPPTTWSIGTASSSGAYTVPGQVVTQTQTLPDGSSTSVSFTTVSSTTGGTSSVPASFAGLVVIGTYIECMRHFRDSYTEIPNRAGMDVTYTDRRDYWQRWQANLQAEVQDWETMVKKAKMSLLSMSSGSVLVAGGIYGTNAGIFVYGQYASAVRSMRFYPAAPAISWAAGHL